MAIFSRVVFVASAIVTVSQRPRSQLIWNVVEQFDYQMLVGLTLPRKPLTNQLNLKLWVRHQQRLCYRDQ